MTKEKLAKESGVSRPMISMMESAHRKHPSLVTVHALATAMGTTVAEIVAMLEDPKTTKKISNRKR